MGFANPGALLLSALLAILVFLYLWERRRRRLDVPSLLLWESVPDAAVSRTRFQPDPLFFLQLAILSALVLGLADPFLRRQHAGEAPGRQIIVLDTSASMQARESGETRLAQAKRAIASRLADLDPEAEVMLVTVANRPNVELPFTSDRRRFAETLERVDALDLGTNLDGAISLAARAAAASDTPTRVDLFTDMPPAQLARQWRDQVSVWPVGETDDNLAIESLRVFQGSFQSPRQARAHVTVRNHSARESHGSLTILVDDTTVDRQLFTIPAGAAQEFSTAGFPRGGLLRAQLDHADALAVDDTALGWVRAPRRKRILLVSTSPSLAGDLRSISAASGLLDLVVQSPDEYSTAPAEAELVLFYRFVPTTLPDTPSLVVFPETSAGFLAARGELVDMEILDWNAEHPALRGLQLRSAFPLQRAKVIDVPPWAQTLLRSRATKGTNTLAFAGETRGQRVAVLAFDLAAEGLLATDHEGLLLLFLNLVDWLTAESQPVRVIHTGDVLTTGDISGSSEIIDPHQRVTALGPNDGNSVSASLSGRYVLRSTRGEALLLANFTDARESDIGRAPSSPQLAAAAPTRATRPAAGKGIGRLLLAAAAALLLLEWPLARRET
jgi:hypothetical protein